MRRATAKEQAKALWLATRDMDEREATKAVGRFAADLVKKGLGTTLADVLAAFPKAAEEAGIDRRVQVASARALSDETVTKLLAAIGAPERAEVVRTVDPSLIAGVRVRTVDRTLDATAARSLQEFKKSLTRN